MDVVGKLTVELDYEIQEIKDGYLVVFKNPYLGGQLSFQCSSLPMAEGGLKVLGANGEEEQSKDPVHHILNSANKLREGINDLKQMFSK